MARKRAAKPVRTSDAFTLLVKSELGLECVREFRFHPVRKWRFDYEIGRAHV